MITAILRERDGTVYKTVEIRFEFYVPPRIIVDGDAYFIRTSADNIHSPLEFVREPEVVKI